MTRPAELAFLDDLLRVDIDRFERANWLKSPFNDMLWRCEFKGSGSFNLDFKIALPSGRLLSETPKLVYLLKLWLTMSTTGEFTGTLGAAPAAQYATVNGVLAWIDYFLLNAKEFEIEEMGLTTVTRDSFKGALNQICSDRTKAVAIYDWERRVISFLRTRINEVTDVTIIDTLREHPMLAQIDETDLEIRGTLSTSEVISMRVWLQINGHYCASRGCRYWLDSKHLSADFYSGTLRGIISNKPPIKILNAGSYRAKGRRYDAISTTRRGDLAGGVSLSKWQYMKSFQVLDDIYRNEICLEQLPSPTVISLSRIDVPGRGVVRLTTASTQVGFQALRGSIEYQIQYGQALVDSYIRLIRLAHSTGTTVERLNANDFASCIEPQLSPLGITAWTTYKRGRYAKSQFDKNPEFEYDLATNLHSFQFCLRVLYGAANIIVGTLMARRQGELKSLDARKALDVTKTYLIFQNEKSTKMMLGQRTNEVRPIASIAARIIANIQRISEELISLGYLTHSVKLCQSPSVFSATTLLAANKLTMTDAMDALCDYVDTPLDNGKRYYLRQHQLRRFFCMVFFWHRSFDGLDTLRWFLGHQDIEHVYRYITESTPGSVLISVKAHHLAENIDSYENLSALLKERFGASQFALLDSEELEKHIQSLIEEGCLLVEPEFYKDTNGTDYRILVKVK